jgi:hypothetical protein
LSWNKNLLYLIIWKNKTRTWISTNTFISKPKYNSEKKTHTSQTSSPRTSKTTKTSHGESQRTTYPITSTTDIPKKPGLNIPKA